MTWNVGGVTAAKLLTTLADFAGSPELKNINVVLVQELITEPGLYHAETDDWQLVFGKMEGEFRGEGIAHRKAYTHHRSKVLTGGVTTQLKHKPTRHTINTLSGHIPHHATTPQTQAILMEWGATLGTSHLLLGVDANETFARLPHQSQQRRETGRGDVILEWTAEHNITVPPQQLHLPSYHPYNTLMQPRRLDYVMARGCTLGDGQVVLCKDRAASDHDGVAAPFGTHGGGGARRASWGPRKLRPLHQVKSILDIAPPRGDDPHTAIAAVAKAITVPGSGHNSFTESRQLKQLRKQAQSAHPVPSGSKWPRSTNGSTELGTNSKQSERHSWTGEPCAPFNVAKRTGGGTYSSRMTRTGNSTSAST